MTPTPRPIPQRTFSVDTTSSGEPQAAPSSAPPRRRTWLVVPVALAVVLAGVGGGLIGASTHQDVPPVIIEQARAPRTMAAVPAVASATDSADATAVGAAVIPSIVTVEVGTASGDTFTQVGSGSGVVLDRSGHIITNHHVVEVGDAVRVVLSDGRVYEAELVGSDPLTDLAVLRVPTTDLVPITLGSTDDLVVGNPAIAIGSPLGLEGGPSLSVGVVSALGREVQTGPDTILYGMIQTDAPITSGSSGGSLVDETGTLIGITTAVGVSNIGVEGIGFATPVEIVERITAELIATGTVSHGLLGIGGATAYDETGDGGFVPVGVTVRSVSPNSPAEEAGVTVDDVITAIDNTPVLTMDELITALRRVGAGDSVIVSLRGIDPVTVTLATR
ncbi:MAG: trypsin-like peptidase domain-containing protein [Actinomycetota bacterium]|nr:trypsin-like peptidase domain-containing protein [Actinomycetota bacterium]